MFELHYSVDLNELNDDDDNNNILLAGKLALMLAAYTSSIWLSMQSGAVKL